MRIITTIHVPDAHLGGKRLLKKPLHKGSLSEKRNNRALVPATAATQLSTSSPDSDLTIQLADELLLLILLSLLPDTPSLGIAAQVCRRWNRVLEDEQLWRRLCKTRRWLPLARGRTRRLRQRSFLLFSHDDLERVPRPVATCKHWKRVYRENFLTEGNWKLGRCRVRKMRDVEGGERDLPMQFDDSWVVSVAMGEAGKVWDLETGKCHLRLSGHAGTISAVKFNRKWVVTGGIDATLKVWDAETGECVRTLVGHTGEIAAIQHTQDTIVSGSEDASVRIWDIETGECREVLLGHNGAVCCLQFDDRFVFSGSADGFVKIWPRVHISPGQQPSLPPTPTHPPRTLSGHVGAVFCLQVSKRFLCSGAEDARIKLWKRADGTCVRTFDGHEAAVVCLQFDDVKIVSGGSDNFIKVWDVATGRCLYSLAQHKATVWNLTFTSTRLTSSSFDRALLIWDFAAEAEADGDEPVDVREAE